MAGTIEEKIYHRQIFKQFLTNRVLKDPKQQRFFKTNDLYELFSLTEGEKEKTESSAIFAGTGSEIKLGVRKTENEEGNFDSIQGNTEAWDDVEVSRVSKNRPSPEKTKKSITQNKNHENRKIKSIDVPDENVEVKCSSQVEKMKELAKLISKKIGNTKKSQSGPADSTHTDSSHDGDGRSIAETSSSTPSKDDVEVKMSESKVDVNLNVEKSGKLAVVDLANIKPSVEENIVDMETAIKTETPSVEDLTALCEPLSPEDVMDWQTQEKGLAKLSMVDKCLDKTESILFKALNVNNEESEQNKGQELHSDITEQNSDYNKEQIKHKDKHKKSHKDRNKEKHKEQKRKGKKCEGKRIEYLVKRRTFQKTEEEEKEERELSKSQDQYVLEKLFRKSGIHGALSHDAIMNNSDPDYLLVEGEADRVAKEALKAVRASRAWCSRPPPVDSKTSHGKSTPKFGKKKSQGFKEVSSQRGNKTKGSSNKDKKTPMFSGGFQVEMEEEEAKHNNAVKEDDMNQPSIPTTNEQGVGSSGMLSSSQLLSRMRNRNKGIALDSEDEEEDGYDPDYPSTAVVEDETLEPEVQENIDLLADIRNFIAFQAEVDGQASTQEIISRFKERLPASQTPFFKALLTKICDFHRDSSGKGIWSLKGEFR